MTSPKPKFDIRLIVWTTSLPAIDTITLPKQTPLDGVRLQFGDKIGADEDNGNVTEELDLSSGGEGNWNGSEGVRVKFIDFHTCEPSF
jgi:hypothetical protein